MPITDEEAASLAVESIHVQSEERQLAIERVKALLASNEPFLDVHQLFELYNIIYFRSLLLPRVDVSWSGRLTLCAGICELVRDPANGNKYHKIRLKLSEPLLKYRPRSDTVNTLLHEAIHAYFFVTTSWRHARGDDGSGHGEGFRLLADAINGHGDHDITVFHTFHAEVESYRKHVWRCDGSCRDQAPFFGYVKRSMNRRPGPYDAWWKDHETSCGGAYVKVAEPEPSDRQIARMTGLERAGRQKSKIDGWLAASAVRPTEKRRPPSRDQDGSSIVAKKRKANPEAEDGHVQCPICLASVEAIDINAHLDEKHQT